MLPRTAAPDGNTDGNPPLGYVYGVLFQPVPWLVKSVDLLPITFGRAFTGTDVVDGATSQEYTSQYRFGDNVTLGEIVPLTIPVAFGDSNLSVPDTKFSG